MRVINYDEMKNMVLSRCINEVEKKRIEEETVVIEERGWEKYIALGANILKETETMALFEGESTLFKSYFVYKFLSRSDYTLRAENEKEMRIFLESPLSLKFNVVAPGIRYATESMMTLCDKILEMASKLNVKAMEYAVEPVDGMPAERIIAAPGYSEEMKKIGLKKEDVERETLMNYITIDIVTFDGI